MIAECLYDYIGLPVCGNDDPESGLNITDQPGISLLSIDKIGDTDKQTIQAIWQAVQRRAINRISSDVISYFSKKYFLKRLPFSVKIRETIDAANDTPASAEYRGIDIELAIIGDTNYGKSGLQTIHVQELRFYSQTAVNNLQFVVIDQDTFRTIDSFTFDVEAGWNTVATNKHYTSYHVFIGYDATLVDSVELLIPEDCGCCDDTGCGARLQGAIYDHNTETLTTGTNTFGLAGTFAVHCSFESIICNNKHLFKYALFNLLAAEIMRERIYTPRINQFTTVDLETAKNQMLPDFTNAYLQQLDQVTDGILLNPNDCCLECDGLVHYQEATTLARPVFYNGYQY